MNSSIGMPEVSQNLGHDPPIVPSSPVDAPPHLAYRPR